MSNQEQGMSVEQQFISNTKSSILEAYVSGVNSRKANIKPEDGPKLNKYRRTRSIGSL